MLLQGVQEQINYFAFTANARTLQCVIHKLKFKHTASIPHKNFENSSIKGLQ